MLKNTYKSYPNEKGYFGQFGGRYVSETLMPLILEVEKKYEKIKILGQGEIKDKVNLEVHYLSNSAKEKLSKNGSTIKILESK